MIDYISIIKMGPHVKFIQLIKYISGYVLRQISNYTDTPPRFANCLFDNMTLKIELCIKDHTKVLVLSFPHYYIISYIDFLKLREDAKVLLSWLRRLLPQFCQN